MHRLISPLFLTVRRKACGLLAALFFAAVAQPVLAQSPMGVVAQQVKVAGPSAADKNKSNDPATIAELKNRLSDAQAELAAVDSPERLASGAPPGTPVEQLRQRVRALRLMVFSYRQHISALGNREQLQKFAADTETKRQAAVASSAPVSAQVLDGMRAELQAAMLRQRSEEARLLMLVARIDSAKAGLAKAGEQERLAQDALEAAAREDLAMATWRRDIAALEFRAQGTYLESTLALQQSVEAAAASYRTSVELQRRKVSAAEKLVVFKTEDLDRLKSDLDDRRVATIKAMDTATRERERLATEADTAIAAETAADRRVVELEQKVAEARKNVKAAEFELTKTEQPEGFLQKINPLHGRSEKAQLDKRRRELIEYEKQLGSAQSAVRARERETLLAIERSRNAVQLVEAQNTGIIALDMQRRFWELRFAALDSTTQSKIDRYTLAEDGRSVLKVLKPAIEHLRSNLEIIVGQLSDQHAALRDADGPPDIVFRNTMIDLLQERGKIILETTTRVEEVHHLLLRWMEDEDLRSEGMTAGERVRDWFGLTGGWLKAAWDFELFAVEDSIVVDGRTITGSRGITVAKVMKAILIVVVGYYCVALTTRFLMGHAIRRGKMEETSARIARKWVLALTLVSLLLLALDIVNIPLTAFAFLGGAIAIGAGFGMQTLLKNLISGVMLLLERPFKPRDIIEVGGIRGEVVDINVRSCTIRDANGIETLVPNSTFLEQNVTNWTLSSRKVRHSLKIGVGYGSTARKVHDLLLEVANRHNQVLEDPPPEALFMDFGDNALMFDLLIWLEIGPGRRPGNVILSDLRFMIETSFAEHGIKIPYPQRDIHLDADAPVPVRIVPAEGALPNK